MNAEEIKTLALMAVMIVFEGGALFIGRYINNLFFKKPENNISLILPSGEKINITKDMNKDEVVLALSKK